MIRARPGAGTVCFPVLGEGFRALFSCAWNAAEIDYSCGMMSHTLRVCLPGYPAGPRRALIGRQEERPAGDRRGTHALARVMVSGCVLLALCGAARADRPAIEQSLREMGTQAAAADVEGYLTHVDRTDPIFFKERENWAKDLKRKTPVSVAFTIATPKEGEKGEGVKAPEFGEKSAHFEMVTTWTMPGATADEKISQKPAERCVSFPVVFVVGESGKWLYAGEDWLTLESGDEYITTK